MQRRRCLVIREAVSQVNTSAQLSLFSFLLYLTFGDEDTFLQRIPWEN